MVVGKENDEVIELLRLYKATDDAKTLQATKDRTTNGLKVKAQKLAADPPLKIENPFTPRVRFKDTVVEYPPPHCER